MSSDWEDYYGTTDPDEMLNLMHQEEMDAVRRIQSGGKKGKAIKTGKPIIPEEYYTERDDDGEIIPF